MKQESLKTLTNAHAWIGIIISVILYWVFLGGSFSLFRDDIVAWEREPHVKEITATTKVNIDDVIANSIKNYNVDTHHRFTIRLPNASTSNYELYFAQEGLNGEHTDVNLLVSGETGQSILEADNFTFGDFLYEFHINLHLGTIGQYFVGIVTLFFFVALLSGIVINWRNIKKKFYQYRTDGKKDKWLDAHNMIGVMGLPFHIMFAFTGLVFNLVIVYQIAYAVALYNGDQTALLKDAGYSELEIKEANKVHPIVGVDALYAKAKNELSPSVIEFLAIEHFGDKNSVITFRGNDQTQFSTRTEAQYLLATGEQIYLTTNNYDNDVRSGLNIIAALHFANFAGYGLKILFFILGIGTCYIILTGNLMWIEKRNKQRTKNSFGLHIVKSITYGGFVGGVFATSVGFLIARITPISTLNRMEFVELGFFIALFSAVILALILKSHNKFSSYLLKLSSSTLLLVIAADWTLFHDEILNIFRTERWEIIIVESILLILSISCWIVSRQIFTESSIELKRH